MNATYTGEQEFIAYTLIYAVAIFSLTIFFFTTGFTTLAGVPKDVEYTENDSPTKVCCGKLKTTMQYTVGYLGEFFRFGVMGLHFAVYIASCVVVNQANTATKTTAQAVAWNAAVFMLVIYTIFILNIIAQYLAFGWRDAETNTNTCWGFLRAVDDGVGILGLFFFGTVAMMFVLTSLRFWVMPIDPLGVAEAWTPFNIIDIIMTCFLAVGVLGYYRTKSEDFCEISQSGSPLKHPPTGYTKTDRFAAVLPDATRTNDQAVKEAAMNSYLPKYGTTYGYGVQIKLPKIFLVCFNIMTVMFAYEFWPSFDAQNLVLFFTVGYAAIATLWTGNKAHWMEHWMFGWGFICLNFFLFTAMQLSNEHHFVPANLLNFRCLNLLQDRQNWALYVSPATKLAYRWILTSFYIPTCFYAFYVGLWDPRDDDEE